MEVGGGYVGFCDCLCPVGVGGGLVDNDCGGEVVLG